MPSFEYHNVDAPTIHPSDADAKATVRVLRNTRVAGRIFLPDGAPAAGGVLVHAWGIASSGNREPFFTRTADNGSYAMRLAPDTVYTITCLDPRGATLPLNGVSVREGVAQEGLDLRMTEGALVRGRVTRGPEGRPVAREQVNVELTEARPMHLWAITDEGGRYVVRLAPGNYTLSAGFPSTRADVHITGREEIVRDLAVTGETGRPQPAMTLAGVVVEKTGAGKRPVAGAELREVITRTTGFPPTKAVADAHGRFVLTVGMRPQLLYARSPDGTLAGYVEVAATGEIEIPVSAAATVLGRVVDRDGRPVPARRISFGMMGGAGAFEHRFLDWQFYTDETGAFLFSGLVPGSQGQIGVPHSNDFRDSRKPEVREFKVPGPEPIALPNIIVPTAPPAK
jgi:hypothetical protein